MTFHRIRCIVLDMNTHGCQIDVRVPFSSTTRTAPGNVLCAFLGRIHVKFVAAFTGAANLEGVRHFEVVVPQTSTTHPRRWRLDDSRINAPVTQSVGEVGDVKRLRRLERAQRRIPLDVEITRSISVGRSRG